jgi:manganese/zinc/iron transport system permease protein
VGPLIEGLPLPYTDAVVTVGAGLLGLVAGVLGVFAVLRHRSMVADALAHAALPGVCIAFLATGAKSAGGLLIGAASAGLIGAAMILGIERTSRIRPDAAIGVVLSGFFSLGIVLLTFIANQQDADQAGLERYLFGQAAGLSEGDVTLMAVLAAAALALVVVGFRAFKTTLFDPAYAGSIGVRVRGVELAMTALLVVAIVVGLRTVGAILMVGLIVVPAAAARQLTNRLAVLLPVAGMIGAGVGISGALVSSRGELPTGPVIVLIGATFLTACVLFAPSRGVLWRARSLLRERRKVLIEGVVIDLETTLHGGPPPTLDQLALASDRSRRALRVALRDLDRTGMVACEEGGFYLTEAGAAAAHALLDRRRLWSAWLDHGWRLGLADAHEPDPRDLRVSLGDDNVDRLEALATGRRP